MIRHALASDRQRIVALVRSERLNPTNLDWRRFTVAEIGGLVVGAVQVRAHRDGARELGSLVVVPGHRGRGIARAMIDAALADVSGRVWMVTRGAHAGHYAAWGFVRAEPRLAPRSVRFNYRMGRAARVISWMQGLPPTHLTLLVSDDRGRGAAADGAKRPVR